MRPWSRSMSLLYSHPDITKRSGEGAEQKNSLARHLEDRYAGIAVQIYGDVMYVGLSLTMARTSLTLRFGIWTE